MEEAAFFPAAETALTPRDWSELAAELTKAPDPLVHGDSEARFEALRRTILAWQAEDDEPPTNERDPPAGCAASSLAGMSGRRRG